MERMPGAELTAHSSYQAVRSRPLSSPTAGAGLRRSGKDSDGEVPLSVLRDLEGSIKLDLVGKGQTQINGAGDEITGLYAAGRSVRDI